MIHVRARLVTCCIAISLSLAAHDAPAAELTLTPVVAEVLQPDLMPFPEGTTPDLYSLHGIPVTLKVDYFVEISNLNEGQLGFGNVVFNVDLFRLQQNSLIPDWQPDVSVVDVNGPALGGVVPKWDDNSDIGQSRLDLRYVFAGLFPRDFRDPAIDPRYRIAQDGPVYLGSTYIDWDGAQPAMLRPEYMAAHAAFSTYGEDKMLVTDGSGPVQYGAIQLGMPTDHQSMRVFDWDDALQHGSLKKVNHLQVDNVRIDVSLAGDLMFPSEDLAGQPHVDVYPGNGNGDYGLSVPVDFANVGQSLATALDFSRVVTDVEFGLLGINRYDGDEGLGAFVDQVIVRGFLGDLEVAPDLTSLGGTLIEGNVVTGAHGGATRPARWYTSRKPSIASN